ncbi:unnamed protein product [Danaus chrysippus]|uniref:(African queen) hypothetical protein n=1 Tax=Danaus chrysippus TaxID=151541 RepID=A0A8J2RB35_9NEOP|nr:unnamed protein product [Danaus chrysippus]
MRARVVARVRRVPEGLIPGGRVPKERSWRGGAAVCRSVTAVPARCTLVVPLLFILVSDSYVYMVTAWSATSAGVRQPYICRFRSDAKDGRCPKQPQVNSE